MEEQTVKRTEKKSSGNNKKCVYKVLALAVMSVLLAAAMVVFENPDEGRTAADTTQEKSSGVDKDYSESVDEILNRGNMAAVCSRGTLYMAYDNSEDLPDVDKEAFKKLMTRYLKSMKLTSAATAVQTVFSEAEQKDDGTYSLTVPARALLINGVESVDRLALYAVLQTDDEIGAKLVEVPYEAIVDTASGNVISAKLSLPSAKMLLIIDNKGDDEAETTAEGATEKTTADVKRPSEMQSAQSREKTTAMENSGTVAEYIDVSGYESTETRSAEKQSVTNPAEKSPVTGGHDF